MGLAQPFGLIVEGAAGSFVPEIAYVQQGNKVLEFWNDGDTILTESLGDEVTLIESIDDFDELIERTINGETVKWPKNAKWIVEGPYQRSDVKNANNRTYKRKIWEKEIGDPKSRIQTAIREGGGLVGHLEHPADGRTDGKEGTIATRSLALREDGVVWGKSDILDTPNGFILQEYTRKGIRWGVSSRGNGSVDDTGRVNEDYQLETFDAVMRPSTPGAYPKKINSSKQESTDPDDTGDRSLSEDALECVTLVESLVATEIEGLDESAQVKFTGDLLKVLGNVNSLAGSDALSARKANELQDWLTKKLRDVHESESVDLEAAIEQALEEVDADDVGEDERDAAMRRVVSSFQSRLTAAVDDAADLQTTLEEVQEQLEEAQAENERLTEQCDETLELLEAAQESLQEKESELDIAYVVISDASETEVQDLVQEAVEDAIEQVDGLEEFREVLERAESPKEVERLAETLLPAAAGAKPHTNPVEPRPTPPRRTSPRGLVVESGSGIKGSNGKVVGTHRGAKTAAGALKHMKSKAAES